MGQEQSHTPNDLPEPGLKLVESEQNIRRPISKRKHEYFFSNSNLESVGDFDSILQALCVKSTDKKETCENETEIVDIDSAVAQQEAVDSVIRARTGKFIRRISEAYPSFDGAPISHIHVSSMMTIIEYCDVNTQLVISAVSDYFSSVVRTTRTTAALACGLDWVTAINRSPYLENILLNGESTNENMERFCRIIKNDGFSSLRSITINYMSDDNLNDILHALDVKYTRSLHLDLIESTELLDIDITVYTITSRFCYTFAEIASNSFSRILQTLCISTDDLDGLINFFNAVDFSDFTNLKNVKLSGCPLQSRGFECLVRSFWPIGKGTSSLPPIRELNLMDTQLHSSGLVSLRTVMFRGALANLEKFDISSNRISHKGIIALAGAISQFSCPSLCSLKLTDNNVTSTSLIELFDSLSLGACPLLSVIEFGNTGVGEVDLHAFNKYIQSSYSENLTRINMSNNPQITPALPEFFESLLMSKCRSIKTLFLEGISISKIELQGFLTWLLSGQAYCLCNLIFKSNLLDQEAFCLLLGTLIDKRCPRIKVIDFSSNLIGNFDEISWMKLLAQEGEEFLFEQIDYSFNPLTDNDMRILLMFMKLFSRVERTSRITFSGNAISAVALDFYFKAFPEGVSSLDFLVIDSCNIAGIGKYLYDFLSRPASSGLSILSLRDCGLTKDDLFDLCDAFDLGLCTKLNIVRFDGNDTVDDTFIDRLICTLEKGGIPNLSCLECGYTRITVVGVKSIIQYFEKHPTTRIHNVYFSSICISSEEKDYLKQYVVHNISTAFHF